MLWRVANRSIAAPWRTTQYPDRSGTRLQQTQKQLQQRALPRTIGTKQGNKLTLIDRDVHVVQDGPTAQANLHILQSNSNGRRHTFRGILFHRAPTFPGLSPGHSTDQASTFDRSCLVASSRSPGSAESAPPSHHPALSSSRMRSSADYRSTP